MTRQPVTAAAVGEALEAFRDTTPLVQCLTNIVVAQWTANLLLAAGAASLDPPELPGRAPLKDRESLSLDPKRDFLPSASVSAAAGDAGGKGGAPGASSRLATLARFFSRPLIIYYSV